MSLASIRNGLVTTLTACGPWIAAEISTCDFGILDHVSGCAIVLLPGESPIEPLSFGGTPARGWRRLWGIKGEMYIKDTGNSASLLSSVWSGHDDLYNTLAKDDSFNDSCQMAALTRLSFAGVGPDVAGQDWAVVRFEITAEEF